MIHSLPHAENERQQRVNGASMIFRIVSWNIQWAVQLHSVIIKLSAAFLWNNGGGNISTMS